MHVIILSHERSLNKAEGLLKSYKNVTLIIDQKTNIKKKPYVKKANSILICKNFEIIEIVKKIQKCDKIWCVSENLLPVQSQLESYYGIENLNACAAEVLSNKQKFDDYCRLIGLRDFVPISITPTFHNQLDIFKNKEFFTKPDIGTGSNVFIPGDDQNTPNIEYRRWNNKHHFLKFLTDKNLHNQFFEFNKSGIHSERFNFKPCKIMAQEYHWSESPSIAPIGHIKDGKVHTLFYLKMSKVKYGDILDVSLNPIESHSVSKSSDIVKDRAVWIVTENELDTNVKKQIHFFMQTVVDNLKVKELFFAGPDFHLSNNKLIAIDFNPRPGQFMNILDNISSNSVINSIINNKEVIIKEKLLWGCAILKTGTIKHVNNLKKFNNYLNYQNTNLETGVVIPEFQNLQNKSFNINLNITGDNEKELFDNYKKINQLLQDCIIYK